MIDGETVAMMHVLQRPPSDSCSSRVSFESRYGTRDAPSRSAEMTRPSVSSDWLIFFRSRSRLAASPVVAAVLAHSDPARSHMCNLPMRSITILNETTRTRPVSSLGISTSTASDNGVWEVAGLGTRQQSAPWTQQSV